MEILEQILFEKPFSFHSVSWQPMLNDEVPAIAEYPPPTLLENK